MRLSRNNPTPPENICQHKYNWQYNTCLLLLLPVDFPFQFVCSAVMEAMGLLKTISNNTVKSQWPETSNNHKQIIKMQARYFGLETESSALAHQHSIPLPVLGEGWIWNAREQCCEIQELFLSTGNRDEYQRCWILSFIVLECEGCH